VRTDEEAPELDRSHVAAANHVSPGYLEMLDIRLVSGRYIEEADGAESPRVIILNQSMARAYYGDADPVGRRIFVAADGIHVWRSEWYEIVGVVADTKEHGIDVEGVHTFYVPAAQAKWGPAIVMDYQGDPGVLAQHVREVIHRMQPNRAVEDILALTALLEQDIAPSRLNAILFGSFAALALLIAALGVLGTLAFSVSQRVREFGIRMAVGADRGTVLRSVLREGVVMVLIALALGTAASLVLGRFLSGLLFGVDAVDLPSMVAAASALGVVALGAALLPALRATRIHPTEALRGD
jgi:putative ABC transport system permease protein